MIARIKIVIAFLLFISMGYVMGKLHLHHYWKGYQELKALEEEHLPTPKINDGKFVYIAHAGGGYTRQTYLNNLEAINHSYDLGIKFIELDFNYTKDSAIVLSHDFVSLTKEEYLSEKSSDTHLSLEQLMSWLQDKNVQIVTDIKVDNIKILKKIKRFEASSKIIPQVYSIPQISEAKHIGYNQIIYTNYVSKYPQPIIKELAEKKILTAITLPYDLEFEVFQATTNFFELQTPILTHTINDEKIVKNLVANGCVGVYTDFLLNQEP